MKVEQRLVVENLCKSYDSKQVVDSLSFSIEPGEVLGLLGPNGAGKTTSVAMLYGAIKSDSGSSMLMPQAIPTHCSEAMKSIGVVTQINSLDPDFNVRDNLLLFGKYHRVEKITLETRVQKLLEQLELLDYAEYRISELSGGLQRRAVLARALVSDPQFIFLDEPTTGFDPDVRQQFWRWILALKDEGRSILLTTHYMDEAQRLCDRIIVIQNGRALDEGTPDELVQRWIGNNVVEIEGLSLEKLRTVFAKTRLLTFARGFIAAINTQDLNENSEIYSKLQQLGATQILFRKANLEDVFLALKDETLIEVEPNQ